jgi:cell wall-associated NlpC family hydrolase
MPKPRSKASLAVTFALAQRGKPYRWASSGPGSFDCSGLTQAAYLRAGLSLPRVAAAQWEAGRHIDLGDLRRGDLVFFAYDLKDPRTIHHVGIYVGGGLMVEAPFTGANVRVSSIGRADYIGAVRPAS